MSNDDFIMAGEPLPRIATFEPLEERWARISWTTGEIFELDLSPALNVRRIFMRPRESGTVFRAGKINEFQDAITWGGDSELSAVWIQRLAREQGSLRQMSEQPQLG